MEKMRFIARREKIESELEVLNSKLKEIRDNCEHEVIIMFKCCNFYWVDAKCLFCGKKMEVDYVLERKEENVVNADLEVLLSDDNKYKIVKENYERISKANPDWNDNQIVAEINKELIVVQTAFEELRK